MNTSKKIVILGAAESGVGSAVLAQKLGMEVFVSDAGKIAEKYKKELVSRDIRFEEGSHTESEILSASEIIKSPGIPDKAPLVKKAKEQGIKIISEIEFAARYTDAKIIAITGTNGKTTTTMLTYHILQKAGMNVGLGGNVGKSFARQVAEENFDHYVLELSSFQLDGCYEFKADIGVLTNITPDHLDRYEYQLQNYVDSKFRILQNQTAADAFIYCADDELTMKEIAKLNPGMQLFPFSIYKKEGMSAWVEDEQLYIQTNNQQLNMSIHDLALQGKHNLYNSMASGIASRILDIRKDVVRESFSDFENIEHRLEFVNTVHGIDFINDSKATNVNSTWYALESIQNPIVWIAGGVDKGNDYDMISELVKSRVKALVCMGVDNMKLIEAFKDVVPVIVEAGSAEEAVQAAYRLGKKGDTVLLSPCCASFDLFENYEDRGRKFKAAVRAL
ncbi:MAG TPA: UDP-N-acetylmuramoyl-L-alanine--D-glutamate ligase [Bacteroidia bacterium]|jgi:UDP-N-acetylmuramoylalanine--D-glutamate ligase|nr:UDP-N-acetylmuramoyl-L-alanine--D-glutamate ligase [Bacteroidia bacterium]